MHKLAATKTITLPTSRSTNLYATTSKSFHGTPPYRGLSSVQEIQKSGSSIKESSTVPAFETLWNMFPLEYLTMVLRLKHWITTISSCK